MTQIIAQLCGLASCCSPLLSLQNFLCKIYKSMIYMQKIFTAAVVFCSWREIRRHAIIIIIIAHSMNFEKNALGTPKSLSFLYKLYFLFQDLPHKNPVTPKFKRSWMKLRYFLVLFTEHAALRSEPNLQFSGN